MGLCLRDVSLKLGALTILRRETMELRKGETLVVTGENGVGKSTFLYLCAGLLPATSGAVLLDGRLVDTLRPSELVHGGVRRGVVFQHGGLLSNMSALANVTLGLSYHKDIFKLSDEAIDLRAREALTAVGLEAPEIHAIPARLSFGLRKRVAFARALALEPNFVFCDDPDSGLDAANTRIIHDRLVRWRDDPEVTSVIVTNHKMLIDRLAIPAYELSEGQLIEHQVWSGTHSPSIV